MFGQWTNTERITYTCMTCRSVSIRAEHVEPLLYRLVSGRLAMPDAINLLKAELHDEAEAEVIRLEAGDAVRRAGQHRRGTRRALLTGGRPRSPPTGSARRSRNSNSGNRIRSGCGCSTAYRWGGLRSPTR